MKSKDTLNSKHSSENLYKDESDQLLNLEKIPFSTLIFNNDVTSIANNLPKFNQIYQHTQAISNVMSLANNLPKPTSIPQIPNITSIISQYTNILSQISIPIIPNSICMAIQQSIRIQDKISYNKDLISSFTLKLKDTKYYDEILVNNLEDISPLLNELAKFPEYQEQFIQKACSYIDKIVEAKVEEFTKIKTPDTTKVAVSAIFIKASEYISNNISSLCDFYNIAPDSMKSDILWICFWLIVVSLAIAATDFYYNHFKK